MTKKRVLLVSLAAALLTPAVFFLVKSDFCYYSQICQKFISIKMVDYIIATFLYCCISLLPFILPFSLITYKMRDDVFTFWLKCSFWGIPVALISAVIIYFSIGGESPFRGGGIMFSWLILYGIYVLLALSLIIYKHFSPRKK